MYRIWFCEYYGDLESDNCRLSYKKVLYEDIKEKELQKYSNDLCKEYHCNKSNIILDKYVELKGGIFDNNRKYCLFFEEELEWKN